MYSRTILKPKYILDTKMQYHFPSSLNIYVAHPVISDNCYERLSEFTIRQIAYDTINIAGKPWMKQLIGNTYKITKYQHNF